MKILVIIPARSGSKRVPGKNIKLIGGKPLIGHTIALSASISEEKTIFVSTDCNQIAAIAKEQGAIVPWLRSADIAADSSDVIDAIQETLNRFEKLGEHFDSVLLLQPTSPFRSIETINKAIQLHKESGLSVVSVSPASIRPSWFRSVDSKGNLDTIAAFEPYNDKTTFASLYELNGSIYLASVEQIKSNRSLYSKPVKALVIENVTEAIDIDTPLDWALAEKIIEMS